MKKILLLLVAFATVSLTGQVTIFEDDFESYADFEVAAIGSWTQIDVDGNVAYGSVGFDFANEGYTGTAMVFNPASTSTEGSIAAGMPTSDPATGTVFDTYAGAKGLYFFAATNSPNGTPENDDYMITPQIDLTGATGSSLSFWAKTLNNTWGEEKFEILLSTTGNAAVDFTVNLSGAVQQSTTTYTEYTYDLSAYDDQQVYIAIHYLATDTFVFQVDDFKVEAQSVAGVNDLEAVGFSYMPNPVKDILTMNANTNINTVKVFNVLGQTVLETSPNSLESKVSLVNLPSGAYFVQAEVGDSNGTFKIIKK